MTTADDALNQAERALRAGQHAEAWKFAAPIVKADPQHARAWRMLADISEAKAPEKAKEYRAKADAIEMEQRFVSPPPVLPPSPMPIPTTTIALQSSAPHTSSLDLMLDSADQAFREGRWADVWHLAGIVQRTDPNNGRARALLESMPPPPPRLQPQQPMYVDPRVPARTGNPSAGIASILGAAFIILGSFLPWATARAGILERTFAGTEGDGVITMAGGAFLLIAGIGIYIKPSALVRIVGILIVLGIGYIVLTDWSNIRNIRDLSVSMGSGLYAIFLGLFFSFRDACWRNA